MGLLAALQFLTILPVKRNFTQEQVGRAAAWFPVVGLVIGLSLVVLNHLLKTVLPAGAVNILLIIALTVFSGGLHLDGFADSIDGLAGQRTPTRRMEIMRDSRIGGIGAAGLALFLILEYVSLNSIPVRLVPAALLAAPMISRWAMAAVIYSYPYARESGLGLPFKQSMGRRQFVAATLITLLASIVLFGFAGIIIFLVTWLVVTLAALYIKRRLTGLTGDTYGAINEIAFASVLLAINFIAYN